MFEKINPRRIIRDHLKTLYSNRTSKPNPWDFLLFFILPVIVSIFLLSGLKAPLNKDAIGVFATSLSIFAALLFNLLLLVYDVVRKVDQSERKQANDGVKAQVLKEAFSNISFSILVSIVSVIFLLVLFLLNDQLEKWPHAIKYLLDFVSYWLISMFILTLFMVLKRVHILIEDEVR
jgi:hypothetical protein